LINHSWWRWYWLLNLITFGNHALDVGIVVLLLNATLLTSGGIGSYGCSRQRATSRTDGGTMSPANRRAKTRAKDSAADAFKDACRISSICLTLHLRIRVLLAFVLFRRKDLKGLSLRWKSANRRPHWCAGAGRKQKRSAIQHGEFKRFLHGLFHFYYCGGGGNVTAVPGGADVVGGITAAGGAATGGMAEGGNVPGCFASHCRSSEIRCFSSSDLLRISMAL
jgi:hypothetical protein